MLKSVILSYSWVLLYPHLIQFKQTLAIGGIIEAHNIFDGILCQSTLSVCFLTLWSNICTKDLWCVLKSSGPLITFAILTNSAFSQNLASYFLLCLRILFHGVTFLLGPLSLLFLHLLFFHSSDYLLLTLFKFLFLSYLSHYCICQC